MPRRSTPPAAPARPGAPARPAPAEPEPFAPAEPWWRQSRRSQKEPAARFEIAAPRVATREETPAPARPRISGAAVAAAVLVLALAGGLGFLVTTDWLAVARASTEIQGAQRLSEDAIYAASQLEGVNIIQVHPGRVAARIKQTLGIA